MTDTGIVADQIGISVALVHSLQFLKNASWFPWVAAHTATINKTISLVVAFGTAIGLQFATSGSLLSGGTISITVPPFTVLLSAFIHGLGQFGIQESYYKSTTK